MGAEHRKRRVSRTLAPSLLKPATAGDASAATSKAKKAAAWAAVSYLLVAMAVFVAHLYSVQTNPADSGESAIPLYLLALPWMMFVPSSWHYLPAWSWLAYPVLWLGIALNAFLAYCVIGLAMALLRWCWSRFRQGVRNG